ncbi:DUF5655 domain-containing protein [uncultured Solobacterium sp.]|jgi:hypothetical protein|uniref:DUF5655 domain-containing protein n=1 Tax=uncultured Solobacterium sp. TaxID=747375 RepID=UPI0028EC7257|nr:DUF5655 domain-containing protein [uncultured Solobacterium sp.]
MTDLRLFSIKKDVVELTPKKVSLEKELQTLIENNLQTFFGVTFLKSEYAITNGRMDSIGIDENNCPVIIEYKRSINENVINQGLFYLDWLLDHKANFQLLVEEVLGKEKSGNIDWSMPCVICIANDFTKFDEHAVNQMQRNIKLVKYRKFDEDLIALELLNAPQVKPITDDYNSVSNINKKQKSIKDFSQSLADADETIKNLYVTVQNYIMAQGDNITENQLKRYVAYKKIKNFLCVVVYQSSVVLYLNINPDDVKLIPNCVEDVRNKGHWGTGDLRVFLKNIDDFEKYKYLIDKSYEEN